MTFVIEVLLTTGHVLTHRLHQSSSRRINGDVGPGGRDQAMDVLEQFAGNESLGLGLDAVSKDALIYSGMRKGLVPEVGLEPT
ncbi:MAG: hypothetical protein ABR501_15270 [Pyrinomonadaceae bacterium]